MDFLRPVWPRTNQTAMSSRKDLAFFGEGTIITTWRSLASSRWLHYNIDAFCHDSYLEFTNLNLLDATTSDSEVVTLANAKYKFNDDVFVYFTRSVGIRNGGVERGVPPRSTLGVGISEYDPDRLVNCKQGVLNRRSPMADCRST
ncbi:MAG: hypothetical protein R3C58_03735 [Parvularculaceae bacterium]